jgi:hypothetical protein
MTMVPLKVPERYPVDGVDAGQAGICAALGYATLARRMGNNNESRAFLARSDNRRRYYGNQRDRYRELEIKWLACALNTSLASRQEQRERHYALARRIKMANALDEMVVCSTGE